MRFLSLILLLCLAGCSTESHIDKHIQDKNYYLTFTPPGCVNIGNGLYYDQSTVKNTDWREYLYWLFSIYGSKSQEFLAALPDTLVWCDSALRKDGINCLQSLSRSYLRNPKYADFPVVGISQRQAEAFAKWRTDRVMEFVLLKHGVIKQFAFNKDSCFTIEKFYSGQYKNIKPGAEFSYYPEYRLPTEDEWEKAVKYDDSLTYRNKKKLKAQPWLEINPCRADTFYCIPTEGMESAKISRDKNMIYNLKDNVSQWTAEKAICVGAGWHDKVKVVAVQDTFHRIKPNSWTGVRYICSWKKWEGTR